MSMNINNNGNVSKAGIISDSLTSDFEFKQVQVGSIFLKDNGDGKISIKDFNHTTKELEQFISQYSKSIPNWTKDSYNAIINYLHKNKDKIKEDSINEVINSFQTKANDNSQISNVKQDGDWEVTEFKDGTFMRQNKTENKTRYYDSQGRWIAGITKKGVEYLNTYVENNPDVSYAYVSEEIGNNNIYYYSKNDKLIMTENDKEIITYIDGPDGKLQQVEQRDRRTGELQLIGYADENEKIVKTREFKKDFVTNKPYIEETDYIKNKTRNIYEAVVNVETMEVKNPETGEITYKKIIDHKNNTITVIENGVTTITDTKTGKVKIEQQ